MSVSRFFCVALVGGVLISPAARAFPLLDSYHSVARFAPQVQVVALDAVNLTSAQAFVDEFAGEAIGFLSDASLTPEAKADKFKVLLQSRFDMDAIGRFAMGRHWNTATSEQQTEYLSLFKKMIVDVYTRRFNDYQGQVLKVESSRAEGEFDAIVASVISQPSGEDILVDWRVRYKNGSYKVIDVIVAGVSMSLTQRSDFAAVIQRGGGDVNVLLAHLRGDSGQ